MKQPLRTLVLTVILAATTVGFARAETAPATCQTTDAYCYQPFVQNKLEALRDVALPKIATPAWMNPVTVAPATKTVTYIVATSGVVTADLAEFKQQANETLNSPLGWSRLGVLFREVATGGDFTLWLSQDINVPTFSPTVCSSDYSCRVGRNVIINQTRWLNGSPSWNTAGGSLRDYRNMVVNHETGHWLGHGHRYCSAAGQAAPLMQQQSIDMQGCTVNPWPLSGEMYSPTLGIRS